MTIYRGSIPSALNDMVFYFLAPEWLQNADFN